MISGPSIVVDVDTDLQGLRQFVSAFTSEPGDDGESVFVCDRERRDVLDWLFESGRVVLVPPAGVDWALRVNQAMALTSGDPLVVASASRPLPEGHVEAVGEFLRENRGGVVLTPDARGESASDAGLPAICRRAYDTLGVFKKGDSPSALVTDYLARAVVAEIPVGTLPTGALAGDRLLATRLPEDVLAEIRVPYESGESSVFEPRCVWRDHKRREPVRHLSFAFVTHNRLGYLQQTWDGLWRVTPELEDLDHEFAFVDNGSDGEVRDWLLERDAWLVFNPENRGIPVARNQALALTTGDPIIMIDPDILLPEGWLEKALEVLSVPGIGFSAVSEEPRTYEIVDMDGVDVEVKRGNIAGVWIIPRSTIDILGFFNEEYRFYGGEDSDYGHRIMVAGMLNTYLPRMKGEHLGAEDGVYSKKRTEYVEMKAKWWDINMALFKRRAGEYSSGQRPLRVERVNYRY